MITCKNRRKIEPIYPTSLIANNTMQIKNIRIATKFIQCMARKEYDSALRFLKENKRIRYSSISFISNALAVLLSINVYLLLDIDKLNLKHQHAKRLNTSCPSSSISQVIRNIQFPLITYRH